MSLSLTFDNIKNMVTASNVNIEKVIQRSDGAVLWVRAVPYSVDINANPMTDVTDSQYSHQYEVTTANGTYYLSVLSNNTDEFGEASGIVVLPTNNCNKVRVKYKTEYYEDGYNVATINGVPVGDNTVFDKYIYFDCSGSTFTLGASVVEATAYFTATLTISEIYFYYE